jgi:hypothetical protein
MGPIDTVSGTPLETALGKIAENDKSLKMIESLMSEGAGITKSGRAVANPITSAARVAEWASPEYSQQMLKTLGKKTMELTNENAILKAAVALNTPVTLRAPAAVAPKPVLPAAPASSILSKLNPILTAVQLATFTGDLNPNEDEERARIISENNARGIK